jgi:gamma-glutamyl phosphate reductase
MLKFGPPLAGSLHREYGGLELTIEIVEDVNEAINHIGKTQPLKNNSGY